MPNFNGKIWIGLNTFFHLNKTAFSKQYKITSFGQQVDNHKWENNKDISSNQTNVPEKRVHLEKKSNITDNYMYFYISFSILFFLFSKGSKIIINQLKCDKSLLYLPLSCLLQLNVSLRSTVFSKLNEYSMY